jgi:hypothetical protein
LASQVAKDVDLSGAIALNILICIGDQSLPSAARMKTLSKGHRILAVLVLPHFTREPKFKPELWRTEVPFG